MQRGRGGDGAADVVGGEAHIVILGLRGDLLGVGEAAKMRDVGLENIAGLEFEEFARFAGSVNAFAGGDRDAEGGHGVHEFFQGAEVFGRDGFFEPAGFERSEFARHFDGTDGGEAAVHLDQ